MLRRTKCPLSGLEAPVVFSRPYASLDVRQLVRSPQVYDLVADKDYEIRHCSETDMYFQTWVMENDELPLWYTHGQEPFDFNLLVGQQKLHWFAHQAEEVLVLRQLCEAKRPKVLDFGCGWGKWASMALAFGCDVYGVEPNSQSASFCSQRGICMLREDHLKHLQFDFINCDQVLEHLSRPKDVLETLAGCLNVGGFLKVSTPDVQSLPRSLRNSWNIGGSVEVEVKDLDAISPLEHINLFSRASLEVLGVTCGLVPYCPNFWTWFGAGQLWNVPRQISRNLRTPFKRWLGQGTYLWLLKK